MGSDKGRRRSITQMKPDMRMDTYAVRTPKLRPKTRKPNSSNAMLMMVTKVPGVIQGK